MACKCFRPVPMWLPRCMTGAASNAVETYTSQHSGPVPRVEVKSTRGGGCIIALRCSKPMPTAQCRSTSTGAQASVVTNSTGAHAGVTVKIFSDKDYEQEAFEKANLSAGHGFDLQHLSVRLTAETVDLAAGAKAVCVFVNDELNKGVIERLAQLGVGTIALRCAGFNNVDLPTAQELGIDVVRVPAYSPNAIAEHTLALILALNRKIPRAFNRVRDRNFSLSGLVGFDLAGKTVGVVGTGKIGTIVARLLWHLRCNVLAFDMRQDPHLVELGVKYTTVEEVIANSDVLSLNCPLLESTYHMINDDSIATMKRGAMLVNTGRGGLVDSEALIRGLKSGQVGSVALDVYEEESRLFFEDRSREVLQDDTFARLLTFPNVLITAHQAFLTREALDAIASTTLDNVAAVLAGEDCPNTVKPQN